VGGHLATGWARVFVLLKGKADRSQVFVKRAAGGAVITESQKQPRSLEGLRLKEPEGNSRRKSLSR